MMNLQMISACLELSKIAETCMPETFDYRKSQGIGSTATMSDCIGIITLARIADHGNQRFDFDPEGFEAVVFEAMGKDGETAIDLVAWPIDHPNKVLTMFGRCGLVGVFYATNPATYYDGLPLPLYRSPLELFCAGFTGAAVAVPNIASRQLLDLPGRVAAHDLQHGIELQELFESNVRGRVMIPAKVRRAA